MLIYIPFWRGDTKAVPRGKKTKATANKSKKSVIPTTIANQTNVSTSSIQEVMKEEKCTCEDGTETCIIHKST